MKIIYNSELLISVTWPKTTPWKKIYIIYTNISAITLSELFKRPRVRRVFKVSGLFFPHFHSHFMSGRFACCNTDAISSLCHLLFTEQFFSIDSCDVFAHQWLQIQSLQTEMTSPAGNTDCCAALPFLWRDFFLLFPRQWRVQTLRCNYCTTHGLHTGFIIYVSSRFNRIKGLETGVRRVSAAARFLSTLCA